MRIASEAMKQDGEDLSIEQFYKAYIRVSIITNNRFVIAIYSIFHEFSLFQTQCDAESKMVKKVLSNLDELSEALSCSAAKMPFPKCKMDVLEK